MKEVFTAMDLYNYTFEESSEDFYLDRKGEIKSIFSQYSSSPDTETTLEEMEEDYACMARERDDLLAAGEIKKAQEIEAYLRKLEDDMNFFDKFS